MHLRHRRRGGGFFPVVRVDVDSAYRFGGFGGFGGVCGVGLWGWIVGLRGERGRWEEGAEFSDWAGRWMAKAASCDGQSIVSWGM